MPVRFNRLIQESEVEVRVVSDQHSPVTTVMFDRVPGSA
jgi:hypothetical protein